MVTPSPFGKVEGSKPSQKVYVSPEIVQGRKIEASVPIVEVKQPAPIFPTKENRGPDPFMKVEMPKETARALPRVPNDPVNIARPGSSKGKTDASGSRFDR